MLKTVLAQQKHMEEQVYLSSGSDGHKQKARVTRQQFMYICTSSTAAYDAFKMIFYHTRGVL